MKPFDDTSRCGWVQENLDAYLEQELASDQHRQLEAHLEHCPDCRQELTLAQSLQAALHDLPEKACPSAIRATVLARARGNRLFGLEVRTRERLFERLQAYWRPALAAAMLAGLLIGGTLLSFKEQQSAAFPPQEVAQAELDLKWTLAFIGSLTRRSTQTVVREVIPEEVLLPLHEAMYAALGKDIPNKTR